MAKGLALDAFIEVRNTNDYPFVEAAADHLDLIARFDPARTSPI